MGRARRLLSVWMACALTISSAGAYYHYIHFLTQTAPFIPVPEKFDLVALPSKTVTFFVSDAGPTQFAPNDSFPSVLSQIRQAALAWNSVATSDLRVAFGGLFSLETPQSTAGGEIVFDDEIPPGLLAFSTHTAAAAPVQGPDGKFFFPITRAIVHMHRDLTQLPGPSFTEGFFLTVVHEMGHALGLQHTFTSSVMSTAVTRGTSLARPLDADDMAALSLLYPRNLSALTGTITGTVTAGGVGVGLASVVAVRAGGNAVSALTNPDGTYRIEGIPPGQYLLYVHPLPPTANIVFPEGQDGSAIAPGAPFDTVFYPNTHNLQESVAVAVAAGASADGKNFAVQPSNSVLVRDVTVYSFYGNNAVHPAYLNTTSGQATFVAQGTGLGDNGQAAPGLGLQVLGGSAILRPGGLRGYGSTPTYLAVDLQFGLATALGPQHLIFSRGSYIYVLPNGLKLVNQPPPTIASIDPAVDANGNPVLAVGGSNFLQGTRIYFDGLPGAAIIADGQHALVTPPPGASSQRSTLSALNPDGQNSMFVQAGAAPTYQYPQGGPPSATFSPNVLPAGVEAMVEINGVNTNFVTGQTIVGFGSSDVFVRRIWVLSPTRILANVAVSTQAPVGPTMASAMSGFQVFSQAGGFQTATANPSLPVVSPQLTNAVWLPSGIYPGAYVTLVGSNLGDAAAKITVNNEPVTIRQASQSQIDLVIPAGLPAGPAILRLNNGAADAFPVVIDIGAVPPAVWAVQNVSAVNIDTAHPAHPGELLTLGVNALVSAGTVNPNRVHIIVGGVDHVASLAQPFAGIYLVQFRLSDAVAAGDAVALTLSIDGRNSLPRYISVR